MSVERLKGADVVIIGMGWTGSIIAKELAGLGLKIVGLERGPLHSLSEFSVPFSRDELKFQERNYLIQDPSQDTVTFRNALNETALPVRKLGSFLPGQGVGGSGLHWNGVTWRLRPTDHLARSHLESRYGTKAIPGDMTLQDWPVTYEELEPFYDRFEYMCGVSGRAGNLDGKIQQGGNPFEGPRSREYPNPPLKMSYANVVFTEAARSLGYHPFPLPAANSSRAYTNPDGITLGECQYCGHCEKYGCEANAKASPNTTALAHALKDPNFELRDRSWVNRVLTDSSGRRATGVIYTDMRTGKQYELPAEMVFVCSFALNTVHLLLTSKIGEPYDPVEQNGHVGRNLCYQNNTRVRLFFEDRNFNPFMGAGALGAAVDDFNGDGFDHAHLGFLGGALISSNSSGTKPIAATRLLPSGTPKWGKEWKEAMAKWYLKSTGLYIVGVNYPNRYNYLSLDPQYKNVFGDPLLRMTFNWTENDRKLITHMVSIAEGIGKAMKATHMTSDSHKGMFSIVPYQTTHITGGAGIGISPDTSFANRYCQSWKVSNLFVLGGAAFPQNASYNPTGAIGAMAHFVGHAVKTRYLKNPGSMA